MRKAKTPTDPTCAKCGGVMQDTDFIADDGTGECCIPHRIGRVIPDDAPTHTPGPWTMGWEGAVREPGLGRPCVGTTGHADWVGPHGAEADARLIAAAPDLLAALRAVMGWIDTPPQGIGDRIDRDKAYSRARTILANVDGDK